MFTQRVRIFERVVNGSKVLWFDQEFGRFYRTLSGAKNFLEAHVQVYHTLKKMENGPGVKIGLVKNINQFDPWRRWHLLDWLISNAVNQFFNDSTIEFLRTGIFKIRIPGLAWINHENPRAIEAVSILDVPIIITENGVADAEDNRRELYIKRYLYAVSKAIENGFDIRGYFYWSLIDNFEWSFGYDMKFGLFAVNHTTQERTLRRGAKTFIDIIRDKT